MTKRAFSRKRNRRAWNSGGHPIDARARRFSEMARFLRACVDRQEGTVRGAARMLARLLAAAGARGRASAMWGRAAPPAPLLRLDRYSTSYSTRELLGVHPSSLVGENASIAPGVRVGPFCVVSDDATIGPNCELGAGVHILGHTTLGPDCVIRSHAVVGSDGPGTTTLGRGNVVGAHAVVGAACQDKKSSPKDASHLRVGDNNDIREHAQLHRSSGPSRETIIGDDNLVMGGAHVAHDCAVGDGVVISNDVLLAGHVTIGDGAVVGGAAAIQQRATVGALAFVAGGARVDGDVPACLRTGGDRARLRGLNVVGLRRAGYPRADILRAMRAVSELWRPLLSGRGHPDAEELERRAEAMLEKEKEAASEAAEVSSAIASSTRASPAEMVLRSVLETLRRPRQVGAVAKASLCAWRTAGEPEGKTNEDRLERLVTRLESALASRSSAHSATTSESPVASVSKPRTRDGPTSLPEAEKLKRLNMKSLSALLQVRGLPTSGLKYELVARLDEHRDVAVNPESNAAELAAEATEVAWRLRSPDEPPTCKHGEPCKERTVRKAGPNHGRKFWACPRQGPTSCKFFSWRMGSKKTPAKVPKEESRGEDMFEDLVIMSASKAKRPTASGDEEGGGEKSVAAGS